MTCFEIKNLKVAFGGAPVLDVSELTIEASATTVIMGVSGSGKTTLLRSLNRLNACFPDCITGGSIQLRLGDRMHPIETVPVEELRRKVGMVFQHPNVLPASIIKNFTVPLVHGAGHKHRDALAIMEEKLQLVGLWNEVKDRLSASAAALSGGQQQRLCLARALALDPEVLLLDEPTSSLDPASSELIEAYVQEIAQKITVIVVTHNHAQAEKLGQRFIQMEKINQCS